MNGGWYYASAALLLALVVGSTAGAQDDTDEAPSPRQVRVQVQVGLIPGDQIPGWAPVEITIDNPLASRDVTLEIGLVMGGERLLRSTRDATLPAQGKRREWFYIPLRRSSGSLAAIVRDKTDKQVVAKGTTSISIEDRGSRRVKSGGNAMRVLYVGGHAGTQARDAQTLLSPGRASELALRRPNDLPGRTEGYSGVDLVALHDADLSGLTRPQQLALTSWVARGGSLLLIPGRKVAWFGSPFLKHFLNGAVVRSVKVNRLAETERRFGALSDEPFSRRDPFEVFPVKRTAAQDRLVKSLRGGRRAQLSDRLRFGATFELLGRVPYGGGEVFVLAADMSLPPFDRWRGLPQLVRRVHGQLERSSFGAERLRYDHREAYLRSELCRSLDSNEDPDKTLVILLVIVYILCVGPINFFVLRQKNRPLLLALTVPAISLVFSLMVFVSGYVTKGLGTVTWRVSVVSCNLDARQATEETAVSIRSSTERTYSIGFEAPLLATRIYRSNSALTRAPQEVEQNASGGFDFPRVALGIWEQAAFEAYASRELGGGLTVQWSGDTPRLINKTQYPLSEVMILGRKDLFFKTGPVPAGKTAEATRVEGIRLPTRSLLPSRCALLLGSDPVERDLVTKALETYGRFRGKAVVVVARMAAAPSKVTVDKAVGTDREVCLLVAHGTKTP